MTDKFENRMKGRSDIELVEIATTLRKDYQPEAVEAAEKEIANRHIDINKVERPEADVKPKRPIDKIFGQAVLVFFIPVVLFSIFWMDEDFLDIFILPLFLLSLLPCGLFGIILSRQGYNRTKDESFSWNHFLGLIGLFVGVFMTLAGLISLGLVFLVAN